MSTVAAKNDLEMMKLIRQVRALPFVVLEQAANYVFRQLVKGTVHDSSNAAFHWTSDLQGGNPEFDLRYGKDPVGRRRADGTSKSAVLRDKTAEIQRVSSKFDGGRISSIKFFNSMRDADTGDYYARAFGQVNTMSKAKQAGEEANRNGWFLDDAVKKVRTL